MAIGVICALLVANFGASEKKIEKPLERLYSVEDPQFKRSLSLLLGPPMLEGNSVETLLNGDQIFPSMLAAIRSAQRSITFETYIYWDGDIGAQFASALAERARAGVKVHVLLDWVGSERLPESQFDAMRAAGVQIARFHEPHWSHLPRLNNRTHRKLLVIDGVTGFTGGVGIADKWSGNAQDKDHWRDTHFKARGPVVGQMQAVFNDNWTKATTDVLHGDRYFPPIEARSTGGAGITAQVFSSSPTGGAESMHLMYLLAITAAQRTIDLESSYFVPDELTVNALVAAMQRGVKVRIITPGEDIDAAVVRRASRALWGPLLMAGATIAEYQPTMFHCKVLVVDGLFVSVGSTNFDNRSFRLNDEANLNILDAAFAAEQTRIFEADLARSRVITFVAWLNRPWRERLVERLASLIDSQL
ncbi:MAG TPA: phospholipase D-like domain-containing protein [Burkholderiaceae bacterium]